MYLAKISQSVLIAASLMLSASSTMVCAQSADAKKPDNSAMNKGDQPTADEQKMNPTDRGITARIRKAIMADKSLSTYAHNVKIISQDGTVTLKGPVRSDDEVKTIVAKATDVTGSADKVVNQLTIQPASK